MEGRVHRDRIAWSRQVCLLTSGRTVVVWAFLRHFTPPGPLRSAAKGIVGGLWYSVTLVHMIRRRTLSYLTTRKQVQRGGESVE